MRRSLTSLLLLLLSLFATFTSSFAKAPANDLATIKELTLKWNEYIVKKDFPNIKQLYADQVSIYGAIITSQEALTRKKAFISKYPDFTQSIKGEIKITKTTENEYKADFQKQSTYSAKTSSVQAYLVFRRINGAFKITSESDAQTDGNLSRQKQKKEGTRCIDVAMEILTTSPTFTKMTKGLSEAIIKNGGTSYGIIVEGSPNPEKDAAEDRSDTYDFNLQESYPDHMHVIARFTFNPLKSMLYEYDVVNDALKPISFDRKLLVKFKEVCK